MKKILFLLGCFLVLFSFKVSSQLATSLEEYYKFDETSGQAVNSVSPGTNNSSSVTASYGAQGKLGNAFTFDGSNDYVAFADHANWTINSSSSLSISMWIYFTGDITSGWVTLWGHQNGPQFDMGYISPCNYYIGWWAGGTESRSSTLSYSMNTWYHIALVKNGTAITFYRNGTSIGTATASVNDANPPLAYIGGDTYSTPQVFKGRIDEVGIWKKALGVSEVQQLYNSGSGLAYPFTTNIPVTNVSVTPNPASVSVGGTLQLTANILPTNATIQTVTWQNMSNPAWFSMTSSGLVTATGPAGSVGTFGAFAHNGVSGTSSVTIVAANIPVTGVSISPTSQSVYVGSSVPLTATVAPSNATNKTVTWSSSNTAVATVNSGNVTGVAAGSATITVATVDGNFTATCAVTVTNAPTANWIKSGNNAYYNLGKVGIGTANPAELLTVNGKILAKEVEVVSSITADYVFEPEYEIMPLTELEIYLKQNKHLPGIPSAAEFSKQGQNLGKMDDLLLRKIEELTIYILEQNKKIEILQKKIQALEKCE